MLRVRQCAVASLLACLPTTAYASNNLHERTKVVWDEAGTCAITVVRSQDPKVTLPYTLPDVNEDGMVDGCDDDPSPQGCDYSPDPAPNPAPGMDEVPDSRRHQFFASCRSRPLDELFPNWIDGADLEEAAATEALCIPGEPAGGLCPLVDPASVDDGDRVDRSPDWSCCTHAMSERVEIAFAVASQGVTWDTSDVPEGVYAVHGYTWEPPYNLWSRRPGFVKVIDQAGSAGDFPAAAIMQVEDETGADGMIDGCETVHVRGCVDAEPGSTLALWWRESRPDQHAWHRVIDEVPVEGGSFDIAWRPHDLPQAKILVRVDVRGGRGTYTAHTPVSLETTGTQQCADAPDPDVAKTVETDNADPVQCQAPDAPRCDCRSAAHGSGRAAWWALGILLLRRRRARKCAKTPLARPNAHW